MTSTTHDNGRVVWRGTMQRTIRKHVRDPETQASSWIDAGIEYADIEVTILAGAVADSMALRAMTNKAKTASALGGAVTVKATNMRVTNTFNEDSAK